MLTSFSSGFCRLIRPKFDPMCVSPVCMLLLCAAGLLLQDSLSSLYTPAQQVMLLALLADLGGRPPQSWLAAHEASLLAAQGGVGAGGQTLGLEGWLLLLQCYGRLMYK